MALNLGERYYYWLAGNKLSHSLTGWTVCEEIGVVSSATVRTRQCTSHYLELLSLSVTVYECMKKIRQLA